MTDRALVVAILGVGLVARVGIALASGNSFQFPDEAVYADTAHRLIAGQGFGPAYARVPAYPVFLASLAGAGWASVLVLRVVQAVLTGFGSVLLYAFTAQAIGRGPALAAALFYAVDPVLVAAAGLLYPEALAAVLMIAVALAALLGVRGDRLDRTALAGLLLGVLIQLRPVALGLIPVLAAWMSVSIPARWSRRLLHSGGLLLACLLSLLPWTYRNYRVHGQLMPVATAGTRAAPVWNSEVAQRGLTVSILGNAWTEPGKFARRIGGEFLHFWEIYPTRLATDNPRLRSNMRVRAPPECGPDIRQRSTRCPERELVHRRDDPGSARGGAGLEEPPVGNRPAVHVDPHLRPGLHHVRSQAPVSHPHPPSPFRLCRDRRVRGMGGCPCLRAAPNPSSRLGVAGLGEPDFRRPGSAT